MAKFVDSAVERVCTGLRFTEGPVRMPDGAIVFSDIPANRIQRWTGGRDAAVFREPSGNSNGLTLDLENRLLACEHGNRRVSRTEPDGTVKALADRYQGKRLNSPNDLVVRSDGAVFFTDPPYGVKQEDRELTFQGVYRLDPNGTLTLLTDEFERPNGLAFSPDEKLLYIADSQQQFIRAYDVSADGTLSNGRKLLDTKGRPGTCDGMKVDREGRIVTTAPGGVWFVSPEGEVLEKIDVPEVTSNCCFGGEDWTTLFITATTSLYRVRLKVAGIAVGKRG